MGKLLKKKEKEKKKILNKRKRLTLPKAVLCLLGEGRKARPLLATGVLTHLLGSPLPLFTIGCLLTSKGNDFLFCLY